MSPQSKKEYRKALGLRYQKASRKQKSQILNEVCANLGFNRKYAVRWLRNWKPTRRRKPKHKPGPKPQYQHPDFLKALKEIWVAANLICSKRLKAAIPDWIGPYQQLYGFLPQEILGKLLRISPSAIDQTLKPIRALYRGKGRCTTEPGLLLKHHIPIKTNQWDESRPGFLETDTVAHCGTTVEGLYAVTTNTVDIATNWSEQRATYGKGFRDIADKIKDIEKSLPFALLGFDCDNGKEFLNNFLMNYFLGRKSPIQFTRSREYQKNDNAHVEGKNYTHVRQWLGYRRFEDPKIVALLNDLYKTEWRLYHNFFIPSTKLQAKERVASKTIKHHDKPKTPYQRILESKHILKQTKDKLKAIFNPLNPFKLKKTIDEKIAKIHLLAR